MIWNRVALYAGVALSAWVMLRLLRLRLHRVYKVFCGFLAFELLSGLGLLANSAVHSPVDYRLLWILLVVPEWALTLWMIYELLGAVLSQLPGLLSFSQRLLKSVFVLAGVLAMLSVFVVFRTKPVRAEAGLLGRVIWYGISLERAIGILALLVLLAILAFILWFPVRMPRNLMLFSIGLVFYFLSRTGSALAQGVLSANHATLANNVSLVMLPLCYAFWAVSITPKGEKASVSVGHGWSAEKHDKLVGELDRINTVLLRTVPPRIPAEPISGQ